MGTGQAGSQLCRVKHVLKARSQVASDGGRKQRRVNPNYHIQTRHNVVNSKEPSAEDLTRTGP